MEYKKVVALYLFVASAVAQTCSYTQPGFSVGLNDITLPLDTITFDNLGLATTRSLNTPLRVTPLSSPMDVTITATGGQVNVRTGTVYLNSDMLTTWVKSDYLLVFESFFNTATVTFENPIRQFSVLVTHSISCIGTGNIPKIYLQDTSGTSFVCYNVNMAPPLNSNNEVTQILKYVGPTANIKHIYFTGCNFAFDNLSFKTDPCDPRTSPCNAETEICHILNEEPFCCAKNVSFTGTACLDSCAALPCDPLATCTNLRYQAGYTCTCPPEYIGSGAPGNCTKLDPAPNTTLDVVPILECIDEDGVAQFGYENNEATILLIEDSSRNNLTPFNVAPVSVFQVGRSTPYPLNAAGVPLNITTDTYTWNLEAYTLEFSNIPARACPIQISIIFQFRITGPINATEFAEQSRVTFIATSGVAEERVILANFTESISVAKRAITQLDVTELEVELSILPPSNDTEPSSADVIRDFVDDQQQDFEHELQEVTPDAQIEVIVTAKEGDNVLRGVSPMPESTTSPSTTPTGVPTSTPVREPVSSVTSSGGRYFIAPVTSILLVFCSML